MNFFVTGIGTDVGKTIVSAILTEALKADYWKPVQSGIVEGKDSDTVKSLISNTKTVIYPETYLLKEPLSPHWAAKIDGVEIDLNKIVLPVRQDENTRHLIIEGAGGLLVPLNQTNYVIDIARKIDCKIIVVISNYLGCINHTLLSLDYLLKNEFKIQTLVFNGVFAPEVKQAVVNYIPNSHAITISEMKELNKQSISNVASNLELNW